MTAIAVTITTTTDIEVNFESPIFTGTSGTSGSSWAALTEGDIVDDLHKHSQLHGSASTSGTAIQVDADSIVGIVRNLNMLTGTSSLGGTAGVIEMNGTAFIHNFSHPTGDTAIPVGFNTFVGVGSGNFTLGAGATDEIEASLNEAFGGLTLANLTLGRQNAAFARGALYSNTTGNFNMGFGNQALVLNTTGSGNIGIGTIALMNNVTGSYNVGIGFEVARFQADGVTVLADPENSVYIGASCRGFDDNDDNCVVIGYQAIGAGANTVVIGNSSITDTYLKGQVTLPAGLNHDGSTAGFFGKEPVAQPSAIADATADIAVVTARLNDLIHAVEDLGLIAS